jgi:hypothetical protein
MWGLANRMCGNEELGASHAVSVTSKRSDGMADDEFKLPGSSLEEVEKVIEAYAQKSGPTTNDDLSRLTGMVKTDVSRNNGFLASVSLIEGGRYKQASELGRSLGMALHHGQADEVRSYWQKTVGGSPFLSAQLTAIRVQKGVAEEELAGKILYNAGAKKNARTEAGARAVVDILEKAALIKASGGKYVIATEPPRDSEGEPDSDFEEVAKEEHATVEEEAEVPSPPKTKKSIQQARNRGFSLAVNLQLQLPEFDDPSKYEDLFKALRKHLLPGDSE